MRTRGPIISILGALLFGLDLSDELDDVFIPLGESLRDPKDVLLSNSAEFVQCPVVQSTELTGSIKLLCLSQQGGNVAGNVAESAAGTSNPVATALPRRRRPSDATRP